MLMNSNEPLIQLEQTSYNYHTAYAIKEITLSIASGEFVGLIGPNGSGKTTLLRLLSGFMQPSEGIVSLDGHPLDSLSLKSLSQSIAVVPQQITIPFSFTGKQIVLLGRIPHMGLSAPSRKDHLAVEKSLDLIGANDLGERTYNSLSAGEKQKVIIAQALARDSRILLLDEPISHLDIKWQIQTLHLLSKINSRGSTVVTAIHDLNLAAIYFPRLLLISKGQLVADGTPMNVLTKGLLEQVYETTIAIHYPFGPKYPQISPMPMEVPS